MVIAADRISDWIDKGAVVSRYYNPGNLFDKVHIVLLNQETPNPVALQQMVGTAQFEVSIFPTGIPHFAKTLGWTPALLKRWSKPIVEVARRVKPSLVRCHWAFLNAFAAREIKKELGVPYIISLHANIDADVRREMDWGRRVRDWGYRRFERPVLEDADRVLPVYSPVVPYLDRLGLKNYEVAFNVVNSECLSPKESYQLHQPPRVACVGRQFRDKNPENLIRAVSELPPVELTLFGRGDYHEKLKALSGELKASARIHFVSAIPNNELCLLLKDFDIFAAHSETWEISKASIEAMHTGLPVILNRRVAGQSEEQREAPCLFVPDSVEGYLEGLNKLLGSESARATLGEKCRQFAKNHFSPEICEERYSQIYQRVMDKSKAQPALF